MATNLGKWEAFLYPLKGRRTSRPQDSYDVKTIEPISCMSRDLANKLEQQVSVDFDELREAKRKLFQTGDNSRTPSPKLPRYSTQQKTEAVDEKGDNGNSDVIIIDDGDSPRSQEKFANSLAFKNNNVSDKYNMSEAQASGKSTNDEGSRIISETLMSNSNSDTDEEAETAPPQFLQRSSTFPQSPQAKPAMVAMSSSQLPSYYPGKVTSISPKDRPRFRQTSPTDHRSTPLSKWTLNMFAEYVEFDKYVRELCLPVHVPGEEWSLEVLYEDVLSMFGANSLKDCLMRENESRVLLDGILMKLSKKYKLRIQMEVQSKLQYLPTGKLDYLITTQDGVPLGCVEAKSPYSMDKKSFCQAVLELNLVQQLALKKEVDVVNTPVFCILSDGYKFIFMQFKGSELFLEHTTAKRRRVGSSGDPITKVIDIRKMDGPDDFKMLISSMTQLITSSVSSVEGFVVKKEDVK